MIGKIIDTRGAYIYAASSVVGKHEAEGPMGHCFDVRDTTDLFGAKTWELAESAMQKRAFREMLKKGDCSAEDFDAIFAGDLQNQCVGSAYGLLDFDIPYFGLYGACSTAAEGIMLAAMSVSAGHFSRCAAVTSSHFLAAERQYRSPTEYGGVRSPTSQWTVTGAAAFAIGASGDVKITRALPGIVIEKGIRDTSNMGAAMAPAAADTLKRYFELTGENISDVGAVITGDLGLEGGEILCELLARDGLDVRARYNDCGALIYDRIRQDKHSGGSGCGCSAVVLAAYLIKKLRSGELKNLLFVGTGAMMSPSSIQQGQSIPAVAHLIRLEGGGRDN